MPFASVKKEVLVHPEKDNYVTELPESQHGGLDLFFKQPNALSGQRN